MGDAVFETAEHNTDWRGERVNLTKKLWIGIAIFIVASPLGLILPDHFKAGAAWGEWGVEEIEKMVGYLPEGLSKLSDLWKAPIPDYAFKGWEEKGFAHLSFAYIMSAIFGMVLVVILVFLIGGVLANRDDQQVQK